jgi:hypothetical protein
MVLRPCPDRAASGVPEIVRGMGGERVVEAQELAEEGSREGLGVTGREFRPARGTAQQAVSRKHPIGTRHVESSV